jgi:CcmD family protein
VIAMTDAGYVAAGYCITFGAIGAYVAWLGARRRAVARALSPDQPPDPPAGSGTSLG